MTNTYDYYTVYYTHLPSGSIGAMGKKNKTLQEAKEQIDYLKNEQESCFNAQRAYYINHITEVITTERIEYNPEVV